MAAPDDQGEAGRRRGGRRAVSYLGATNPAQIVALRDIGYSLSNLCVPQVSFMPDRFAYTGGHKAERPGGPLQRESALRMLKGDCCDR